VVAAVSTADPRLQAALNECVTSLDGLAHYTLDPAIEKRLRDLGERKEFLDAQEHDELLALVAFTERRTIEKLGADHALKRLREVVPELLETN